MIYTFLSQIFVVAIYALFLPIFLGSWIDSANLFTFRLYDFSHFVSSENFYPWENLDKVCREILILKSKFHKVGPSAKKRQIALAGQWLVRFPNCHECQLGFQCPKKWELWKQWPILEENSIAAATYWDKLTSYMSHKAISATKKSPTVTVAQLEDPTCHPPNPHFGWRPFSTVGFVPKVILYLRK